jgi:glycosyltransferase involved in cell wall biosynthesis
MEGYMNRFKIVIPVYNAAEWIKRCLWSVMNQNYKNWELVIIDDASTDNTGNIIEKYLKDSGDNKYRCRYFRRDKNTGALENIVYGISTIAHFHEDIIVLLDGDDCFITHDVLEHLNNVYQDPNIWLTYGQYQNQSNRNLGNNKPLQVPTNIYRYVQNGPMYWCTSHLRTFKNKIWKRVQDVDLRDVDGNYFAMAWDMAIMYPLIEMSGNQRIKYIDKIMYLYNDLNPINDFKKNLKLQQDSATYIKQKMRYRMLNDAEI